MSNEKNETTTPDLQTSFSSQRQSTDEYASKLQRRADTIRKQIGAIMAPIQSQIFEIKALERDLADLEERIPAPTAFTHFSKLPKELQLQIWKYVAHEDFHVRLDRRHRKACGAEIPAIFQACHDSRDVAIKECSPYFFEGFREPDDSLLNTIKKVPLFAKLRYVEIGAFDFEGTRDPQGRCEILQAMPELRKLTLHGLDHDEISEYHNVTGKRENEDILRFWVRKRGMWSLTDGDGDQLDQIEIQRFLQLVDDGLFCDTTLMPSTFASDKNAVIQNLRFDDTYKWPETIESEESPYWVYHDHGVLCKKFSSLEASGVMFLKNGGVSIWHGFTTERLQEYNTLAFENDLEKE